MALKLLYLWAFVAGLNSYLNIGELAIILPILLIFAGILGIAGK